MYKDIFDRVDKIRTKYGEVLFRCGLSHLFAKGTDHFDDENVEATIKAINAQDDSRMVMTNGFQIDIVKCAKELSSINITDLFLYIQRDMVYDVFDGSIPYKHMVELLQKCVMWIAENNEEAWTDLTCGCGFKSSELEWLGCGYIVDLKSDDDDE